MNNYSEDPLKDSFASESNGGYDSFLTDRGVRPNGHHNPTQTADFGAESHGPR